jgi:outer membrane biosynthesis protein TonB
MTAVRLSRSARPPDPRFGWLLLVSLAGHSLLLAVLTADWPGPPRSDAPPPVIVDLVHKPGMNPQAGRPEPRKVPAPAPPPKAALPSRVAPPAKAPPVKAAPRAAAGDVQDALQKLRDEQALQQKLAALRQTQAVPMDTPVGLPDAKGSEAAVTSLVYVQGTIQQNWALSPYLLADPAKMARIEAWVRITYGKSGRMESFRFEKGSGDRQFDESIKRALVKSQQLPSALPVRLEDVRVVFNLKAMAELQR